MCYDLAWPISASLHPGDAALLEEMSRWWQAVGDAERDFTGPRFESKTSRSRDEQITARPTDRYAFDITS